MAIALELGGEEHVEDREGEGLAEEPAAEREDVGVVVLAREAGRGLVVTEGGPRACTLLAAICSPWPLPPSTTPASASPRTTARAGPRRTTGSRRPPAVGAEIGDLVTALSEVGDDGLLQLEPGVVASHCDAHAQSHQLRAPRIVCS